MNILVTGATGFVGTNLVEKLFLKGHNIIVVSRNNKRAQEKLMFPFEFVEGDLSKGIVENLKNYQIDAVVNLAGENVGESRWSEKQKNKILSSRGELTKNLLNSLPQRPSFFIQASAIGIYKDSQGDEIINEDSDYGDQFLSQVCKHWERPIQDSEIKHCIIRIGVVLEQHGSMIKKLLPIYRAGIGGKIASGRQWMSWIHLEDLTDMIIHCLVNELEGVYNGVAPNACRNEEFNKIFSHCVQRPALFPVPSIALKTLMGEQAQIALGSQRLSTKITETGFRFKFDNIKSALEEVCAYKLLPPNKSKMFHHKFRQVQYIEQDVKTVFDFFKDAKNLEKSTPPYLNFKITYQSTDEIEQGTVFRYKLKVHGMPVSWETHITDWIDNERFSDYQNKGPYNVWYHTHTFLSCGSGTLMIDDVRYRLPLGMLGEIGGLWLASKDTVDIFSYRAKEMKNLIESL